MNYIDMSYWREAGFTFVRYSNMCAMVTRSALKVCCVFATILVVIILIWGEIAIFSTLSLMLSKNESGQFFFQSFCIFQMYCFHLLCIYITIFYMILVFDWFEFCGWPKTRLNLWQFSDCFCNWYFSVSGAISCRCHAT